MFKRRKERKTEAASSRTRRLQAFLDEARTFHGVEGSELPALHLRVAADERVYLCIQGAWLYEAPPEPDIDLARIEAPSAVRTSPAPVPVDRGEFAITSDRAVFTGTKQIRQWHWGQLVAVEHSEDGMSTRIEVSNRRRTFGVIYDRDIQEQFRFSLDLAVANAQGTRADLVLRLEQEIERTLTTSEAEPH